MAHSGLYVKLDTNFPDGEKIEEVGLVGAGLYAMALCLAKRLMTDGRLTRPKLYRLGATDDLIAELVRVDLFGLRPDDPTGVYITAWLAWNESVADIEAHRAADAQRKRLTRANRPAGQPDTSERPPAGRADTVLEEKRREEKSHLTDSASESADDDDDDAPQANRKLPRAEGRQQRAVEACELIGDRNHDRAVHRGQVHNGAGHRQACRSSARADHLEAAQRLAADHPDWTPRQIAEHVDAPERPPNTGPDVAGHYAAVEAARRDYDADLPERAPTEALLSGAARARAVLRPGLRAAVDDPTSHQSDEKAPGRPVGGPGDVALRNGGAMAATGTDT